MIKMYAIGNLGRDPEVRPLKDGKKVASFSLACTDGYGDKKTTIWLRCELWDKLAETAEKFLTKGAQVFVEGSYKVEQYTDKEGNQKESQKLVVREMKLIGGKSDKPQDAAPVQAQVETAAKAESQKEDDDLPF